MIQKDIFVNKTLNPLSTDSLSFLGIVADALISDSGCLNSFNKNTKKTEYTIPINPK